MSLVSIHYHAGAHQTFTFSEPGAVHETVPWATVGYCNTGEEGATAEGGGATYLPNFGDDGAPPSQFSTAEPQQWVSLLYGDWNSRSIVTSSAASFCKVS